MKFYYITDEVLNSQSVETIHIDAICKNLSVIGYSVSLFAPNSMGFESKSYQVNSISTPKKAVSVFFQIKLFFRLRRESRSSRPDVIYIRNSQLLFIPAVISRIFKIPLVLEANGRIIDEERQRKHSLLGRIFLALGILKMIESFNVKTARKIIVVTEGIKEYFVKNYGTPLAKIKVIANGVDTEFFKPITVKEARTQICHSLDPARHPTRHDRQQLWRTGRKNEFAQALRARKGNPDLTKEKLDPRVHEDDRKENLDPRSPRAGARLIEHNHLLGVDDLPSFAKSFGRAKHEDDRTKSIYIGYIGSFYSWQGLRYIVEAAKIVAGKRPCAKFLIVGNGDERDYLTSFVKDNGLENSIEIRPAVSHSLVSLYYNALDICLCYPTKFRAGATSPFKVYEYLACGRAVILADIVGMREEFGDAISYVEAESYSALAEKIISLIDNPQERTHLGVLGRKFVEQGRSWRSVAEKIAGICHSVIPLEKGIQI